MKSNRVAAVGKTALKASPLALHRKRFCPRVRRRFVGTARETRKKPSMGWARLCPPYAGYAARACRSRTVHARRHTLRRRDEEVASL